jgi:hypothetical protein
VYGGARPNCAQASRVAALSRDFGERVAQMNKEAEGMKEDAATLQNEVGTSSGTGETERGWNRRASSSMTDKRV